MRSLGPLSFFGLSIRRLTCRYSRHFRNVTSHAYAIDTPDKLLLIEENLTFMMCFELRC